MQKTETLAQELTRLVAEYRKDHDPSAAEAWNLIADFTVGNVEALTAALSSTEEKAMAEPLASFAWNEGVESAPYSTTVLATYFDMEVGEWIVKIFVADRPTAPFTHWMWIANPGEAAELPWRNMDSAPRTGEEFIARLDAGYPAFSCFWDGEAFVHYDKDDGFIRYPVAEWLPMPTAAQQDYETRIRSALVDVPAVEEPARWMVEERLPSGAIRWEVVEHENHARKIAEKIPNVTVSPLYAHPPRSSLIQSEEGKITLTIKEAEKLAARLEFDASWDKCGEGYYSIKNQLRALSTPPSPYGGDNGGGAGTSAPTTKGRAE